MNSTKSNKPKEEKLTEHFSFEELTYTSNKDLKEKNIEEGRKVKDKLIKLAEFAESVRGVLCCPMFITSGFRCEKLNNILGGSPTSQHRFAEAIDFYTKNMSIFEAYTRILISGIAYGQIILEKRNNDYIIHISTGFKRQKMYSPQGGKYDNVL